VVRVGEGTGVLDGPGVPGVIAGGGHTAAAAAGGKVPRGAPWGARVVASPQAAPGASDYIEHLICERVYPDLRGRFEIVRCA
jgi:hypothetical protein